MATASAGRIWPDGVPNEETLDAFLQAFGTLGYLPCDNADLETGYEKVALYVKNGVLKHAARQLTNGRWESKLGAWERIEHEFDSLEGSVYGQIVQILRRQKSEATTRSE